MTFQIVLFVFGLIAAGVAAATRTMPWVWIEKKRSVMGCLTLSSGCGLR